MKRLVVLLATLSLLLGAFVTPAQAGPPVQAGPPIRMAPTAQHKAPPTTVRSLDDVAKKKLDPKLRTALASGANGTVAIYTTVVGNPANAVAALDGAHVAATPGGKAALVVGRIKVQQLP